MNRVEAAKIYLDGLLLKNVNIEKFFESARSLSNEDKARIQLVVEKYSTSEKDEKGYSRAEKNFQYKGGDKRKCLVI